MFDYETWTDSICPGYETDDPVKFVVYSLHEARNFYSCAAATLDRPWDDPDSLELKELLVKSVVDHKSSPSRVALKDWLVSLRERYLTDPSDRTLWSLPEVLCGT